MCQGIGISSCRPALLEFQDSPMAMEIQKKAVTTKSNDLRTVRVIPASKNIAPPWSVFNYVANHISIGWKWTVSLVSAHNPFQNYFSIATPVKVSETVTNTIENSTTSPIPIYSEHQQKGISQQVWSPVLKAVISIPSQENDPVGYELACEAFMKEGLNPRKNGVSLHVISREFERLSQQFENLFKEGKDALKACKEPLEKYEELLEQLRDYEETLESAIEYDTVLELLEEYEEALERLTEHDNALKVLEKHEVALKKLVEYEKVLNKYRLSDPDSFEDDQFTADKMNPLDTCDRETPRIPYSEYKKLTERTTKQSPVPITTEKTYRDSAELAYREHIQKCGLYPVSSRTSQSVECLVIEA